MRKSDVRVIIQHLLIGCFLMAGFFLAKFNILYGAVFLAGAPLGLMLLSSPRRLFYLLFLWVSLTPNFIILFQFRFLSLVDEVLSLLIFGVLFVYFLMRQAKFRKNRIITGALGGFLFVYLASLLWNHNGYFNGLRFFLSYGRPFVVFAYVYSFFSGKDMRVFLKGIVVLIFVQLFLNTLWMSNLIPHYRNYLDKSTGTFETCATTAYFFCMVLLVIVALFANAKNARWKVLFGGLFIISIIQIFFTFTNHSYFLFAISLSGFAVIAAKKYAKALFAPQIVIGALLFLTLFFSFEEFIRDKTNSSALGVTASVFTKEALYTRIERLKYESLKYRLFDMTFSGQIPEVGMLGAGPGILFSTVAYRSVTPLVMKYVGTYFFSLDASAREASSVTGHPYSAVLAITGDLGFLGLFFYGLFYVSISIHLLRFIKSRKYFETEFPAMFEAFIPCLIFYVLAETVWDLTSFKVISVGFWAWAALLLKEIDRVAAATTAG